MAAQHAPQRPQRSRAAGLLAGAALLAGGCTSARTSLANLAELYSSREGERATYAQEVTDRGFFSQSADDLQSLVSDQPPERDVDKLKDPVEFALDNLNRITDSSEDDLDPLERCRGVAITADIAMLDPSRIVRMRAYEAAATLLYVLRPSSFRFDVKHVDEAAVNAGIDALLALATTPAADWSRVATSRTAEIVKGAQLLGSLRPEEYALANKLLLLATKCGRIVERCEGPKEAVAALTEASNTLAHQVAFLAARPDVPNGRGLADPALEVRGAAGRLLVALDPVASTEEIGKLYIAEPSPLVRIVLLKALSVSGMKAAGVHPTLRGALAQELESDDASVEHWAKWTLATLLAMDPEKSDVAQVRARWLALGEWDTSAHS